MESWKNTRQKDWPLLAPSVDAAIRRRRSIWFITGSMVTTASGSSVCVIANTTVARLNSN